MNAARFHARGEADFRRQCPEEDDGMLGTRSKFHRLVARLCRRKGIFARWRIHRAWRGIRARHDKSEALWLTGLRQ